VETTGKKPGFPLQSFLPLRGKKGFPLQSLTRQIRNRPRNCQRQLRGQLIAKGN
jgi:hypothetical protein